IVGIPAAQNAARPARFRAVSDRRRCRSAFKPYAAGDVFIVALLRPRGPPIRRDAGPQCEARHRACADDCLDKPPRRLVGWDGRAWRLGGRILPGSAYPMDGADMVWLRSLGCNTMHSGESVRLSLVDFSR